MRFTKFSVKELVEEFKNPDMEVKWKLFQLDDIWNILLEGGEEAKEAEAFLRGLLDNDNFYYGLIVFHRLAALKCIEKETDDKLIEFSKKSENEEIYHNAGELMI